MSRISRRQQQQDTLAFMAIGACILIGGGYLIWIVSKPGEPAMPRSARPTELEVVRFAQEACRRKLEYPRDARFHDTFSVEPGTLGENSWYLKGQVTARSGPETERTLTWTALVDLKSNGPPREYKLIAADVQP
jgi:hypothetical protein